MQVLRGQSSEKCADFRFHTSSGPVITVNQGMNQDMSQGVGGRTTTRDDRAAMIRLESVSVRNS